MPIKMEAIMQTEIRWNYLDFDQKLELKNEIEEFLNEMAKTLNLKSLRLIVACDDFNEDVISFQKLHGLRLGYTNNANGVAGAKALSYIEDDEYKVSIFLSPILLEHYIGNHTYFFHVLHHELCHVHEGYISYELYGENIEECFERRLDKIKFAHAELIWSEYIATRLAISSINENNDCYFPAMIQAIIELKGNCKKIYEEYSLFDDVFREMQLETSYLLKMCSYSLGYLHGLKTDMESIEEIIFQKIEMKYFEEIFHSLDKELKRLFSLFPNWDNVEELRTLSEIVFALWERAEE